MDIKKIPDMITKPTTHKQTNNWPIILFETAYFPFEKKKQILVRLEPGTAVQGIVFTSTLKWPG